MIAVIFEAQPHPGRRDAYLDAAARLRPLLEKIDGFVSIFSRSGRKRAAASR